MKIMSFFKRQNSVVLTTIFGLIVIGILICLPTGYEDALIYQGTERAVGKVVGTDNSAIITSGLIQSGEQLCTLEIGNGIFAGQTLEGVNFLSGSLEKELVEKYGGVTAEALVESALKQVKLIEEMGYDNLVISIKSSDVLMCVKAHELIAKESRYPLHVGITESGTLLSGNIKSSVGLGIILYEGIGDTIRVSLTGDPVEEIKSAKLILKTLGLRKGGVEVVSCPTCGRTKIDLIGLANQVEDMVKDIDLDIKVAVMGCVVNGPGEAREADIGIAGGIGEGLLIKKGEIIKKLPENELLPALRDELLKMQKGM